MKMLGFRNRYNPIQTGRSVIPVEGFERGGGGEMLIISAGSSVIIAGRPIAFLQSTLY